ncbi:transporter substrate-binding domain-containing protein [Actibacterium lipolyticum]|uniref:Glutamine-binding periplasmic protein n=1 Tax=Actibacterium lipolyticum TaxID=1524263 RepID=A0A238KVH6_9RHOB|nr:transporter substrate-binding domain-containing protein [Actibacterium lipolyticum]SMX46640.1 Glutamine-binding periplasmic protein precursor [Actibacterium lipolyticum]
MLRYLAALVLLFVSNLPLTAKAQDLTVVTVERPPFSTLVDGEQTGFSIELWNAVAKDIGITSTVSLEDGFSTMLGKVENGEADVAVANISITAEREQIFDFSHSIFESGLQIMVPANGDGVSIWSAILSRDLLIAIVLAFLLLFGGGMAMWHFERDAQPYFDRSAKEAMFPSFWWALNLVVNGGFEERVPRTFFGRIFGTFLVVSSLFIVSLFVAKITAVITVDAIQGSVNSVNDLYGKRVATIENSTAARFMEGRDLDYDGYPDLDAMIAEFESGKIDAVVFDAPVLAYYAAHSGREKAQMVGAPFRLESYGFALQGGNDLLEPIDRSLLKMRENGTYDRIYRKYFGARD